MDAIKNFLSPTRVTWWVFVVCITIFIVSPFVLIYLIADVGIDGSYSMVIPYIDSGFATLSLFSFFLVPAVFEYAYIIMDSRPTGPIVMGPPIMDHRSITILGYMLFFSTLLVIFWIVACTISKIWYAIKNKLTHQPINHKLIN